MRADRCRSGTPAARPLRRRRRAPPTDRHRRRRRRNAAGPPVRRRLRVSDIDRTRSACPRVRETRRTLFLDTRIVRRWKKLHRLLLYLFGGKIGNAWLLRSATPEEIQRGGAQERTRGRTPGDGTAVKRTAAGITIRNLHGFFFSKHLIIPPLMSGNEFGENPDTKKKNLPLSFK